MAIQSTRCAAEELVELEEWLRAKGLEHVEKSGEDLEPGEYTKQVDEPGGGGDSPVWTITWHPKEE